MHESFPVRMVRGFSNFHFGKEGGSHFSEIVVWWLDLGPGSHGQRAQILFQTFPPKLESACDDSLQSIAFCHQIRFPT